MFFNYINRIMTQGVDLTIVIRKKENLLTVSTLPKSNGLKDEGQNHIVPLTLSGTPEELDTGFFPAIQQPIQKTAGLISNMVQFEQQAQKAAENSKAAKEMKERLAKEEKEKKEQYEKHLKKAEEQIAAQNYSGALTALQQARTVAVPQQVKTVDEKIKSVKDKFNQGSLFDLADMQSAPQPPQQRVQQEQQSVPQIQPPVPQAQPMRQVQYPQPTPVNGYQQPRSDNNTRPVPDQGMRPAYVSPKYDPDYSNPDDYAEYVDFPGFPNNQMSNQIPF